MRRLYSLTLLLITILSLIVSMGLAQSSVFTTYPPIPGSIITTYMNDIGFDNSDRLWVLTRTLGSATYDSTSNSWWILNSGNGLPSDSAITIDFSNNEAWIGTKNGAIRYSGYPTQGGNVVATYTTPDLPSNIVTEILAETNYVWFGTYAGLARLDITNNSWAYYTFTNDSVTKIMRDGNGDLWVGTRNGLSRTNNNGSSWTTYSSASTNGILEPYIYDLEYDIFGRIWISSGTVTSSTFPPLCGISYFSSNVLKPFRAEDFEYGYVSGSYSGTAINFAKDTDGLVIFVNSKQYANRGDLLKAGNCDLFTFKVDQILSGNSCPSAASSNYGFTHEIMPNGKLFRISTRTICPVSFEFQNDLVPISNTVLLLPPSGNTCSDCAAVPVAMNEFDGNLVRTTIMSGGDMHWDLASAKYEVPKGSGKNAVFASAHWIGGLDANGQVRVAGQTYRQTGNDYWAGPLTGMNIPPGDSTAKYFDRVYKVSKWEIESFKNHYQSGTASFQPCNNNVALGIINWPAKGNGPITGDLAPFVDVDGNGLYNPLTGGDYPDIQGDQLLYKVYNDSLNVHTETGSPVLGLEFRTKVYGFNCDTITSFDKVINYTTFYNTEIINRSNNNYTDVYFGLWVDIDLGDVTDDYVGCDVTRNTGYGYNGDADDGGATGYGLNPPVMNVKILRGPQAPTGDGIDNNNNGMVDESGEYYGMNYFVYYNTVNNHPTGNPNNFLEFYNYMQGIWLDGEHISYGGTGRLGSAGNTGVPCNFMFSNYTDPNFQPPTYSTWTEAIAGNTPGDRRFLMSSGPFTLNAGDTVVYDYAYIFTRDSLTGGNLNFTLNNINLDLVQAWFDNQSFPGCTSYSVGVNEYKGPGILVYPNPAADILNIKFGGNQPNKVTYEILNLLGEVVTNGILNGTTVNISHLAPQMYVIQIHGEDTVWITRFVKQ